MWTGSAYAISWIDGAQGRSTSVLTVLDPAGAQTGELAVGAVRTISTTWISVDYVLSQGTWERDPETNRFSDTGNYSQPK